MKKWKWLVFSILLLQQATTFTSTLAALPCGAIIAPRDFFDSNFVTGAVTTRAIENCADPFMESTIPPSPYTLKVDGKEVVSGGTVTVPVGGTNNIVVAGTPHYYYGMSNSYLFRHEGDEYVYQDMNAPKITAEQYLAYVPVYFENSEDLALYIEIVTTHVAGGDTFGYFIDVDGNQALDSTGAEVGVRFGGFLDAAESTLSAPVPMVRAGTYTMVIKEVELLMTQNTWQQKLHDLFIKTAHAETANPNLTYTITFTINEGEPVVQASSVLFLPGIMGSRLFEDSGECSLFGSVSKRERWFSSDGCDIERLLMNESGESINTIYTEQTDGVIEDIGAVLNLYESLLEDLAQWKADGAIADFRAVPYDWRLSLQDILKAKLVDGRIGINASGTYQEGYVYQSLQALAEASPKEKVVLVGHSNGGLVIQALLATMKANNDPLLASVEKVILVAVPQVGTPESVVGILHGVQMGPKGTVISNKESRKLMNTSPFAYNLLPSSMYFDMTETPVITFESGTSTDAWITQFGSELNTVEEVNAFLVKESGRETPAWGDVHIPATIYSHLLEQAKNTHSSLNDWRPSTTAVYEVVGVGAYTPATLTYFTDTECIRTEPYVNGIEVCVEFGPKLGYRISEAIDGDGTVVAPSAAAIPQGGGVEKWWVDLKKYKSVFRINRIHRDITEVKEVRTLIANVSASSATGSYTYLGTTIPNYDGEKRLVYQLHSPLDMYVVLDDGEVVGSSTPMLRGVEYRRYGEVQYLSIPEAERGYEVRLSGLATGSFTLDIEQYEGNLINERVTYSALPSDTATRVVITTEDIDSLSDIEVKIDYEGDGIFETVALPGLGQVTFVTKATTVATSTSVSEKSSQTGTKVGKRGLTIAPVSFLAVGSVESVNNRDAVLLQLIAVLTQYRDLLIKLRVQ